MAYRSVRNQTFRRRTLEAKLSYQTMVSGRTSEQRIDAIHEALNELQTGASARLRALATLSEAEDAFVFEGPVSFDRRLVALFKQFDGHARKLPRKNFEWTLPMSQVERMIGYLPGLLKHLDTRLTADTIQEHGKIAVAERVEGERRTLYFAAAETPVPGEIFRTNDGLVSVCISCTPFVDARGRAAIDVRFRQADAGEGACYERECSGH